MILRESALFSRGCKPTSLEIIPYQVMAKVSAPSPPGCMPRFVFPQGSSGGDGGDKNFVFLCTFMGYSSEASMKFGRNSTTEKSPIRRLLSRGNTSPLYNFWHFFRCVP